MFSDFYIGDGNAHNFWSKSEVLDYWIRYATHFNVIEHIRFSATVIKVEQLKPQKWHVTFASGEVLECKSLVLAIGNNTVADFPEWYEQVTAIPTMHSKDYRNAKEFKNKRVLVVGGGESASDIALEISKVAEKCWVSLRNGTGWVVPRKRGGNATDASTHRGLWNLPRTYGAAVSAYLLKHDRVLAKSEPDIAALVQLNEYVVASKGVWGTYGTKTLALPKAMARHGYAIVSGVTGALDGGKTLQMMDGTRLEDLDIIVFGTGFRNLVPVRR